MIDQFSGEYRFLSNFYAAIVTINDWQFPTAEHAYQAAKSTDPVVWRQFQHGKDFLTAGQAKRLGSRITMRPDWNDIKLDVMDEIVHVKFEQNSDLMLRLIMTNPVELVEGNRWGDTFWGVCNGVGTNYLGKILMTIRQENI